MSATPSASSRPQFLRDIGATSNETLLQYTTGTEVG